MLVEFWRGNILQNAVREIGKEIVPGSSCMSFIGDIWSSEPLVSSVTVVNYCNPGRERLTRLFFKTREMRCG